MLAKCYHRLLDALALIAALGILFLTLGVTADVLLRFMTGRPIIWMFDVSQYALLYIPCLGMAWLARERGHIAITTFVDMMPMQVHTLFSKLTLMLSALACGVISYWGWIVLFDKFSRNTKAVQVIVVPEYLIYWVIPFGFGLTCIEFVRQLFLKPKEPLSGDELAEGVRA